MDNIMRERVLEEATIFIENKTTVRGVAKIIGVSKSTIHKDFIEKLENIDFNLYGKVMELLKYNKDIRHIRGGQATKKLYEGKKDS